MTYGTITRQHLIGGLALGGVNEADNTVYGTANTGETVYAWANVENSPQIEQTVGEDGNWTADFGAQGLDLQPGMDGRVETRDEDSDATSVEWRIANPRIVANLDENWIALWSYPPNAFFDITVYDADGTVRWTAAQLGVDSSGNGWVNLDDPQYQIDLLPGMIISVTEGTNTRTLDLEGLTFDTLNLYTGNAEGTAPEPFRRNVWVGIGIPGGDIWSRLVTTNKVGKWAAAFDTPVPENYEWAAAQIFDEDGDASEVRPARVVAVWGAVFYKDLPAGFWSEGTHSYQIGGGYSTVSFNVSNGTQLYDGSVLLRPMGQWYWNGGGCDRMDSITINPGQSTRFHVIDITDPMTRKEFEDYAAGLSYTVSWDGGAAEHGKK